MTIFYRIVFLLLTLFSIHASAQYIDSVKPVLWLQNSSEVLSKAGELPLNFDNFPLKNTKTETSVRNFSGSNHIFIVYKSEVDEALLSIIGKGNGVFVGSNKVFRNENISMEGYSQPFGELVDVKVSNIEKGKLWVHPTKETKMYEIMVFDTYLSPLKANEIRTYLAIKYGLDLSDTKQYVYNSENLWDKTGEYDNHIFGIGYFSAYNLLQKKSVHSKDKDLIISYASRKNNKVKRGDYILLGSNGQKFHFDAKSNYNKKEWLCRTNVEESFIDLYIPLEETTSAGLNRFVVEIHSDGQKRTYVGAVEKEHIVFRNIRLSQGDYTVKLKGEKAAGKFNFRTDCEHTYLTFSNEFKDSFDLQVFDDNGKQVIHTQEHKNKIALDNNRSKYFDVRLQSEAGKVTRRIHTLSNTLAYEELKESYSLNESGVLSVHIANNSEEVSRRWEKDGELIAEGNHVQITEPGIYTLISTSGDCSINQSFTVAQSTDFQQWTVYPNPAKESDLLTVSFDLEKEQNVKVDIYHIDGKRIKTLSFENVLTDTFEIGRLTSGQYIVVAYIDALPQIKKIIIQ